VAWLQAALIALVTFWVYSPAISGDWLWDDSMYLSHNSQLAQPGHLWKVWFQPGGFIEYYPIEQTVQWIQWQLWGNDTFPYHLTNILLHVANALLLWRLLARLGVKLAWIGGLIFAVHPMNVESVAWISEFKNCLSLAPALLAMSAWIDYSERRRPRSLGLCLAFFVVSMLCKITLAMFPFVILLYAWWKRGRVQKEDVRASLLFLLISAVLVALTLHAGLSYMRHAHENLALIPIGGPLARLALAGTVASFYFAQIFAPLSLLPIYPQWPVDPPTLWDAAPWLAFGALLVWLWTKRAGWGRHALFGLGFFFLNLAPFSGLHGISYMSFTWVMDHLLYLPAIGVIALVAAALGDLDQRIAVTSQVVGTALVTLLVALLAFRAHWYAAAFTGEETLWTYTIERNPGAWLAQNNLGKLMLEMGRPGPAANYFAAAVSANPALAELHSNLGNALVQAGRVDAGLAELELGLQMDPFAAPTNNNLGIVLARSGKLKEALPYFITAVRAKPDDPEAYSNLGNTFLGLGRPDAAVHWYEQAITLKPDYIAAHDNLGIVLGQLGRIPQAITQFEIVLQLDSDNQVARENLAKLRQGAQVAPK
jgi:tetratricopeptide (TPR) repeat protein